MIGADASRARTLRAAACPGPPSDTGATPCNPGVGRSPGIGGDPSAIVIGAPSASVLTLILESRWVSP